MGIGSIVAVTGFISLAAGVTIAASAGTKVSIGWLITFHLLNSIGFANVFPFHWRSTRVSHPLHCRPPSSASFISTCLPRTISSAGSGAF